MFAADVDGDRRHWTSLSASEYDDTIAWYENDGDENFTQHTLTTSADGGQSVFAADLDGDGDLDVLSASEFDDTVSWCENDGAANFAERTIITTADGARSVFVADVDGDGDLDVLSASEFDDTLTWYENAPENPLDYSDAPEPYPTLAADNGPWHLGTGPTLGTARDGESNGQPTASADGDDLDGSDDEDGVTFGTVQVGQLDATVTVNVQNAPSGAKLDAWIDFNGDGCWGGSGEQIADALDVAEGENAITFDVPSWATDGETYARFRLSTEGDLAPTGGASDGEVEDYQLTLTAPEPASGTFIAHTITTSADYAVSVFGADMDGDGDMDVLSASEYDDTIAWYENNGDQSFAQHTITTSATGAHSVFAGDVDGDGDLDVLAACYHPADGSTQIAWYENDSDENFTTHIIDASADYAISVFAADVDGDGDPRRALGIDGR